MLRIAIAIWLGLIGYKLFEVYHYPSQHSPSSVPASLQEPSLQKPAFNPEWKGNTPQKIKAPRNTKAQMNAANPKNSSGS